ncbi:MAG: metallophosphoesterase [bacterium]
MSFESKSLASLVRCLVALLAVLSCVVCSLPWREAFFYPTVEQRVSESLAMLAENPVEPPDLDPERFRFALFGDPHVGKTDFHRLDRFREEIGARGIDFVCVVGDLTDNGIEPEVLLTRELFDSFGVPVYAVPGNHDLWSAGGWELFKDHFGPGNKSFRAGPVRVILFDTSCGTVGPTQFEWLEQELARPEAIKVIGAHYPLYTTEFAGISRLPSEAERYRLSALLRDAGAWGLVSGHIHGFELKESAGVRYFVCGAMRQKMSFGPPGYLLLTFESDSLSWEFVPLD